MIVGSVRKYVMHYGSALTLICLEMFILILLTYFYIDFMGLLINPRT
jgi:hypothetical protein